MFKRNGNQLEIHCDHPRCAIRLGLGPVFVRARFEKRPPSSWVDLGGGRHLCPMHPTRALMRREAA
jgi:hypothetical protein